MNYAIIGFGGLGKTHFINLLKIQASRGDICLKAICNAELETITKSISINIGDIKLENIDFSNYNLYTDYKEMVKQEELDFVIITLPSYMHCEVAVYCLNHSIDVYTEKPMAITMDQCNLMVDTAKRNGKHLMVGHCLRFSEEYKFLKDAITTNKYGKVIKAEFSRKSALPKWSFDNWLLKDDKSGGCIVDLHVHDVDIMVWLFGKPNNVEVVSSGYMVDFESTYSIYGYSDKSVSILTDWGIHASYPFKYTYGVTFEYAYVECINGEVVVYTDEKSETISLDKNNCFYDEMAEFIDCVVENRPLKTVDTGSVYDVMELIFTEKQILQERLNKSR